MQEKTVGIPMGGGLLWETWDRQLVDELLMRVEQPRCELSASLFADLASVNVYSIDKTLA